MRRRAFLGCSAVAGVSLLRAGWPAAVTLAVEAQGRWGPRARLVGEDGGPFRASQLVPRKDYVFLYPHAGTPAFLLDLGTPVPPADVPLRTGGGYAWPGGVGRLGSIVAYAAICPHTYTHPTRDHAMIHYFPPDQPATVAGQGGIITCCVHGSAFDPTRGAVPLQPPAELPLAAVRLEWDAGSDELYATGVIGRPVFEEFFKSFPRTSRQQVESATTVFELSRYSAAILPC